MANETPKILNGTQRSPRLLACHLPPDQAFSVATRHPSRGLLNPNLEGGAAGRGVWQWWGFEGFVRLFDPPQVGPAEVPDPSLAPDVLGDPQARSLGPLLDQGLLSG